MTSPSGYPTAPSDTLKAMSADTAPATPDRTAELHTATSTTTAPGVRCSKCGTPLAHWNVQPCPGPQLGETEGVKA